MNTRFIAGLILALFCLFYLVAGITNIDPGEVGILIKKVGTNRGMQKITMDTGIYWNEPFQYDVVVYDGRRKQYKPDKPITAQSKDGQPIAVDVRLEIGLIDDLVPRLHETIGPNWFDRVIYPELHSAIRDGTAEHESEVIYTAIGRQAINLAVQDSLTAKGLPYGISIDVNLRDLSFINQDFVNTIEQKAKEAQNVIIAERKAEAAVHAANAVINAAEGAKQKAIKESEAEREKLRLQGEGERLKQEETAKGILAIKQSEAEGARLMVAAFGSGDVYASVRWAETLGANVQVLGYPLGAEGTMGLFAPDGVLSKALQLPK